MRLPSCNEFLHGADHLGNMLIGMKPGYGIQALGKAVKYLCIVKHCGRFAIALFSGKLEQQGQGFIHSSIFPCDIHAPHFGPLSGGGGRQPSVNPKSDPLGAVQRGFAVQLQKTVQETGKQFI